MVNDRVTWYMVNWRLKNYTSKQMQSKLNYHLRQKTAPFYFMQCLYQTSLHSDNFWHTYTSINFLTSACFTFCHAQPSSCFIARRRTSSYHQTSHTLVLWITVRRAKTKEWFYKVTTCARCRWVEATSYWQLVKHSADMCKYAAFHKAL